MIDGVLEAFVVNSLNFIKREATYSKGDKNAINNIVLTCDEVLHELREHPEKSPLAPVVKALAKGVEYESKNLDKGSFETDADYQYALGHADGLSDALAIANGEDYKEILNIEEK